MLSRFEGFLLFNIEVILHITPITFSEKLRVKLTVMKQIIVSILLFTASANLLFGQSNKEALIKEAEEKLKTNNATIAQLRIKNMMQFINQKKLPRLTCNNFPTP